MGRGRFSQVFFKANRIRNGSEGMIEERFRFVAEWAASLVCALMKYLSVVGWQVLAKQMRSVVWAKGDFAIV